MQGAVVIALPELILLLAMLAFAAALYFDRPE